MIDSVISVLAHMLMLISCAIIYVILFAKALPKVLLKPSFDMTAIHDRGLKKYAFDSGRAITYEPNDETKKYIEQYILSVNGDEKYLKCKLNNLVTSIKYNVTLFDTNDRLIDVMCVNEIVSESGMSRGVMLPSNTAYACVTVCEVNAHITGMRSHFRLPLIKLCIFSACVVICTAAVGIMFNLCSVAIIQTLLDIEMGALTFADVTIYCGVGVVLASIAIFLNLPLASKLRK